MRLHMRQFGNVVLVLALGGFIATTLAQDAGTEWQAPARAARKKNPTPADDKSMAAGKVIYLRECRSCHGDSGKGDGPSAKDLTKNPGNLTTAKFWGQTDGALLWKVTEGNKPMPAFDKLLSDDDRWNVVNYLHTYKPKDVEQPK